ncbi:hypothetical protein ACTFIW_003300 [Dictyostelium discoideum]
MYIGRLGDGTHADDGIYILMKEVIDNSIDEFIMDHEKSCISVQDRGRGIPLGKVVERVSQINTGAKYNDDVFQFSVGLNGVGLKALNTLSYNFKVQRVYSLTDQLLFLFEFRSRPFWTGSRFSSENRLLDLLKYEVSETERLYEPLHIKTKNSELAFLHTAVK